LLYDCEELKEVDFVKMKPMDYKSQCNEKEDQYQFEIRLKVLSSQLEGFNLFKHQIPVSCTYSNYTLQDMFFRIRFTLRDIATKTAIPGMTDFFVENGYRIVRLTFDLYKGLSIVSDPIKVISKPDQIKKKPSKPKKRPG